MTRKSSVASIPLVGAVVTVALCGCAHAADPAAKAATQKLSVDLATAGGSVWWEAEQPTSTNFPPPERNPFAPANATEAAVLSGGKWIGTEAKRDQTLFLEYTITVLAPGTYDLYARKFWKHGPFRWRIGDGAWQNVGADAALLDDAPIRQFVGANWVHAGTATISKAGPQRIRIELTGNEGAGAFDAFLLTTQPFTARGSLKPGEKYNRTEPGWFAFEPDPDPFQASPIDLRGLNEKSAGDGGWIKTKGEAFVHGKSGAPVRFWAVNAGGDLLNLPPGQMDYMARQLAKYGVNMVRVHTGYWKDNNFREPDPEKIARLQRFVAAMKRQGIYTSLSTYFPLWLNLKDSDGFAGYGAEGKHPFALLFFNKEFQEIYKGWWRAVLTSPNPYGVPLAKDPSVAFAELVNEDSYLFWTFTPYENIPGPQMNLLEKQFGDWLTKQYGSVEKGFAAWGGSGVRGDDVAAGRAGFMPLWEIFNKRDKRAQDTARFLTESQAAFFADTTGFLKNTLGYGGLVYGSNWITADARRLGPLDKLSNTTTPGLDFLDRHGYFDAPHEGDAASYSLRAGHHYRDLAALNFAPRKPGEAPDFNLPIMDVRYDGRPSILSEFNWTPPNRFRADLPLTAAAYGALQGTDGLFFFAQGGPTWNQTHGKFDIQSPVVMGQFPAAALLYRKGYVQPGPAVAEVMLDKTALFALEGAPVSAPQNLEAFRAKDVPAGKAVSVTASTATLDPLAFLVGRVTLNFTDHPAPSLITNLSSFIDRERKVVKSGTGQLAWNWGDGRVAVNAPQAQGITGFLAKAGPTPLADVTVESPLEYGTVLVVSLDDKPLKTSGRMLLQVMSEDRNYGWQTTEADAATGMREIKSLGSAPILVRDLAGTVTLRRPDATALKVTPLDANGYPLGPAKTGAGSISLRRDVLYYLITR